MLARLRVRNLVVIPELEVSFGEGLTAMTGDSGAGKSALLTALGLALGARASSDRIRQGASRAEALAEFDLPPDGEIAACLRDMQLHDPEDGRRCVTRRVLERNGRSHAFVNDTPVTRATLSRLGEMLLDIHAQGEGMRIVNRDVQLAMLDDFGVGADRLAALRREWTRWREALRKLEELASESGGGQEAAMLATYQLQELDELAPEPGEYDRIDAEHAKLSQIDSLREVAARADGALERMDGVRAAASDLANVNLDDPDLVAACEAVDSALSLIDSAQADLRRFADRLEPDPERLSQLDARIARMHEVARKHQTDPRQLPEIHEAIAGRVSAWSQRSERQEQLSQDAQAFERRYREAAGKVRKLRQGAAKAFGSRVGKAMRSLGVAGGSLTVEFRETCAERGIDAVEFRICTRPGAEPLPLAKVASGGEQARIALSVAMVAAEQSALPCLVLDEADIGVGGVTADRIGRMLHDLAERAPVICITHAPQVAAFGDRHLRVERADPAGIRIEELSPNDRVEEIARMLSGARVTDTARANARELLKASQG